MSSTGGTRPLWSRNGRELHFLAADGSIMSAPVSAGAAFSAGNPTRLFGGDYSVLNGRTYDVSADGSRFLMIKDAATSTNTLSRLIVVENWFEELKHRVPVE